MSPVEVMLSSAVAGLTSAVVYMFAVFRESVKEIKAALKDCEEDREELWRKLAGITGEKDPKRGGP